MMTVCKRWAVALAAIAGFAPLLGFAQGVDTTAEPMHIALVIGNTAYSSENPTQDEKKRLPRLPNACSDAQTVAAGLVKKTGWVESDITLLCDVTTAQMLSAIRSYVQKVQDNPYSIAIFYFAGHGIQIDKKPYIFGVDAEPNFASARRLMANNSDAQLFYGSALDVYGDFIAAAGAITDGGFTVIIDACRSDPLLQAMSGGTRPVTAPLERTRHFPGVLLAVSTQEGEVAADNGAYAAALEGMMEREEDIDKILTRVASKVYNDTKLTARPQIPTMSGGLVVECFAGCSLDKPQHTPPVPAEPSPQALMLETGQARLGLIRASFQQAEQPLPAPVVPDTLPASTAQVYSDPELAGSTQVPGVRIDVFYCEGGASGGTREELARRYGEMLGDWAGKSRGRIISVRVRPLSTRANGLPTYRFLENAVVVNPFDRAELDVARHVQRSGEVQFTQFSSRTTPNYVSLFFCQADTRVQPAEVFWHAPGAPEESLASGLRRTLPEGTGQFRWAAPIELLPERSPAETQVRYFHADDRDVAFSLADSLQVALRHAVAAVLLESERPVSPGNVEVWIGAEELASSATDAVEPGSVEIPSRNAVFRDRSLQIPDTASGL